MDDEEISLSQPTAAYLAEQQRNISDDDEMEDSTENGEQRVIPSPSKIRRIEKQDAEKIRAEVNISEMWVAVKELLENAIDAGAKTIEFKFFEKGTRSIEVIDNGYGVPKEDRINLCKMHYTSKDYEMGEYGFRGQALRSICACCETIEVITKTLDEEVGEKIVFQPDGSISFREALQRDVGTTVIVKNIFNKNPPRRIHLMKTMESQYKKCIEVIKEYAIIKPVKFIVKSGSNSVEFIKQSSDSLRQAICSCQGTSVMKALKELQFEEPFPSKKTTESGLLIPMYENYDANIHKLKVQAFLPWNIDALDKLSGAPKIYVNYRPVDMKDVNKSLRRHFMDKFKKRELFCVVHIIIPDNILDKHVQPDKRKMYITKHEEFVLSQLDVKVSEFYGQIESATSPAKTSTPTRSTKSNQSTPSKSPLFPKVVASAESLAVNHAPKPAVLTTPPSISFSQSKDSTLSTTPDVSFSKQGNTLDPAVKEQNNLLLFDSTEIVSSNPTPKKNTTLLSQVFTSANNTPQNSNYATGLYSTFVSGSKTVNSIFNTEQDPIEELQSKTVPNTSIISPNLSVKRVNPPIVNTSRPLVSTKPAIQNTVPGIVDITKYLKKPENKRPLEEETSESPVSNLNKRIRVEQADLEAADVEELAILEPRVRPQNKRISFTAADIFERNSRMQQRLMSSQKFVPTSINSKLNPPQPIFTNDEDLCLDFTPEAKKQTDIKEIPIFKSDVLTHRIKIWSHITESHNVPTGYAIAYFTPSPSDERIPQILLLNVKELEKALVLAQLATNSFANQIYDLDNPINLCTMVEYEKYKSFIESNIHRSLFEANGFILDDISEKGKVLLKSSIKPSIVEGYGINDLWNLCEKILQHQKTLEGLVNLKIMDNTQDVTTELRDLYRKQILMASFSKLKPDSLLFYQNNKSSQMVQQKYASGEYRLTVNKITSLLHQLANIKSQLAPIFPNNQSHLKDRISSLFEPLVAFGYLSS